MSTKWYVAAGLAAALIPTTGRAGVKEDANLKFCAILGASVEYIVILYSKGYSLEDAKSELISTAKGTEYGPVVIPRMLREASSWYEVLSDIDPEQKIKSDPSLARYLSKRTGQKAYQSCLEAG